MSGAAARAAAARAAPVLSGAAVVLGVYPCTIADAALWEARTRDRLFGAGGAAASTAGDALSSMKLISLEEIEAAAEEVRPDRAWREQGPRSPSKLSVSSSSRVSVAEHGVC